MLRVIGTNFKLFVTISGIILFLTILAVVSISFRATAQDESLNMQSRLEQLRDEMNAGNLMIGFQFVTPISPGDNYWLFGDTKAERQLTIEEIGDDYFCFSESSQQAVLIRCVPYTNIASFDYLGN